MKTTQMRFLQLFILFILMVLPVTAQTNTIIAVQSDVTDVQTGRYYTLNLIIRDVTEVWQIDTQIEYDPNLVYVVGTVSGSPLTAGDFFSGEPALVIRNTVNAGTITYTHSLLAPGNPKSGSGTIATFQVYPLSAGTTQIRFNTADLTKVNYVETSDGNREVDSTEALTVSPAFLELNITGETVPPPDEATPTPAPTATTGFIETNGDVDEEATLVNVTLAPETPVPLELIPELEDGGQGLPILPIAIGLLVVGLIGGVGLFMMSRRQ